LSEGDFHTPISIKRTRILDWFAKSVSPREHKRGRSIRERGKTLTTEGNTKSPLGIKMSTEENSNHHGEDLGTECNSWRNLRIGEHIRGEKVSGRFRRQELWSDQYLKPV
jgi:hypothetical protein